MKISIKIKFSIFLAFLLLITVIILSLSILAGIQKNQKVQVEQFFAQQAETANMYFHQTFMAESIKVPQTYLEAKGADFVVQLEQITGQSIVVYDQQGDILNNNATGTIRPSIQQTLDFAHYNKSAYLVENDSLYYMTPLRAGNEQVGVIQFYYSMAEDVAFYNQIKQMFIYIGAGVFLLNFILAYFYFNSFASGIIKLNKIVDRIRQGSFQADVLSRKDEIGELSQGIRAMSEQIKRTMSDKDAEREKLALAVQKLSLLDQQQKQFIGNVTHEFKTPLTSIKAYIDLLDMYPDDDQLLENSKTIIGSETQRLYEMVEKVLQLSAMEKYDFEYSKEKVDVLQAIEVVLNSLKGKLDKFGIKLDTNLTEACVAADKDSLTIVLINLLDNAIKYNKPGGRIAVSNYQAAGEVIIEISDSGIGIPEELVHKVFEPFFMVDKNRSRESGGYGLGLSLAKKHTETQGGTIQLVRTGSEGTLFRIKLPAIS